MRRASAEVAMRFPVQIHRPVAVYRLGVPPEQQVQLEKARQKLGLATAEEVLNRIVVEYARKKGVRPPKQRPLTAEHRELLIANGLISAGNVESLNSDRRKAKRKGAIYMELIFTCGIRGNWVKRLAKKINVDDQKVINQAYDEVIDELL